MSDVAHRLGCLLQVLCLLHACAAALAFLGPQTMCCPHSCFGTVAEQRVGKPGSQQTASSPQPNLKSGGKCAGVSGSLSHPVRSSCGDSFAPWLRDGCSFGSDWLWAVREADPAMASIPSPSFCFWGSWSAPWLGQSGCGVTDVPRFLEQSCRTHIHCEMAAFSS